MRSLGLFESIVAKPPYFVIAQFEVRHCRWVGAATKLKAGGMGCTLGSFGWWAGLTSQGGVLDWHVSCP